MARHVSISTKVLASQDDLSTLLWNALVRKYGDAEDATIAIADKPLTMAVIRHLVRQEIMNYGIRSVECGPHVDYYAPAVESQIRCYVSLAFQVSGR